MMKTLEQSAAFDQHMREKIQQMILGQLSRDFLIPEVIEGLTNFFMDVVQEDQQKAYQLGCFGEEQFATLQ